MSSNVSQMCHRSTTSSLFMRQLLRASTFLLPLQIQPVALLARYRTVSTRGVTMPHPTPETSTPSPLSPTSPPPSSHQILDSILPTEPPLLPALLKDHPPNLIWVLLRRILVIRYLIWATTRMPSTPPGELGRPFWAAPHDNIFVPTRRYTVQSLPPGHVVGVSTLRDNLDF
ncbi:hypothetical protein EDB87DRAFT_1637521 [Lactarius vividus]|nr:hypothetical protein EDB87DRAFT_1637521 [Lactarius vividus]